MFEGKLALVTGARRGIGLATARLLAAAGAKVALVNRSGDGDGPSLDDLARSLAAGHGTDCLAITADMADPSQVSESYRTLLKQFGRLDILVNNAGILGDARLGMIPDAMIRRVIDTNLVSVITNIQAASKLMRRGGGGAIVSVTSIVGVRGNPGQVVYAASKAGIVGATLSAAKELAPDHIRVNAVAPGFIDTDMIRHLDPEVAKNRLDAIPLGRAGSADEVAEAIVFLASDKARYITGQVLGVDGGMVL